MRVGTGNVGRYDDAIRLAKINERTARRFGGNPQIYKTRVTSAHSLWEVAPWIRGKIQPNVMGEHFLVTLEETCIISIARKPVICMFSSTTIYLFIASYMTDLITGRRSTSSIVQPNLSLLSRSHTFHSGPKTGKAGRQR